MMNGAIQNLVNKADIGGLAAKKKEMRDTYEVLFTDSLAFR